MRVTKILRDYITQRVKDVYLSGNPYIELEAEDKKRLREFERKLEAENQKARKEFVETNGIKTYTRNYNSRLSKYEYVVEENYSGDRMLDYVTCESEVKRIEWDAERQNAVDNKITDIVIGLELGSTSKSELDKILDDLKVE